jgi:hypothetical protein
LHQDLLVWNGGSSETEISLFYIESLI